MFNRRIEILQLLDNQFKPQANQIFWDNKEISFIIFQSTGKMSVSFSGYLSSNQEAVVSVRILNVLVNQKKSGWRGRSKIKSLLSYFIRVQILSLV